MLGCTNEASLDSTAPVSEENIGPTTTLTAPGTPPRTMSLSSVCSLVVSKLTVALTRTESLVMRVPAAWSALSVLVL